MLDLIKSEEDVLSYWKEHDINAKVKAKNRGNKPFYFLDGPPFVTGDLHLGQVWTKAFKDLIVRYKRSRGFDVVDRAGYDTQGLPAEVLVEKKLNITSKKDIEEKIGIENFIRSCRELIDYYMSRWENDFERFGVSLDFSRPYLPHTNEYMEGEWALFKRIDERGYLYAGKKTTAYCPHCECVVSQGSMEVEHSEEKDPSILITFKIDRAKSKGMKLALRGEAYLLVWTTTPWTLPANVAVAVAPQTLYVVARIRGREMILAKGRLDHVSELLGESAVVLQEFYGSELEGARYVSALEGKVPMQAELRKYHKVIAAPELVTGEEGTGLVHIAPGHGLEDYAMGVENKLPVFCPVGADARYTAEAGSYVGIKVPTEANAAVLADLAALGVLEYSGTQSHSYPHCWRCHSKIIFIATPQWFLNVQRIKKKLLAMNDKIGWHPEEARAWERDLINSSPDWCISRQRYWATPMPVWICEKCGERTVIGSRKELEERAIDKVYAHALADLHRPFIDGVVIRCASCGGESRRIKDVLDVWFDSGMSFRLSLTEEEFERLAPVDFVVEYIEQTRAWFSVLLKCSAFAYGKSPMTDIAVHGILLSPDGKKMSKSLGNFVPVNELVKKMTADSCRLWFLDRNQIDNVNMSDQEIRDNDKIVMLLHNVSNMIGEYSDVADYKPKLKAPRAGGESADAWLLSRYATTLGKVTESLDAYEPEGAIDAVKRFLVDDISRFYLKAAKKRITGGNRKSARAALDTINYVFFNTLIMMAPMVPFVTEGVYRERYAFKESIFLEDWPKAKRAHANARLEEEFAIAQEAITALLNSREKANVKLRWPIANAAVEVNDNAAEAALLKLSGTIEDFVNAKKLNVKRVEAFGKEIRPTFTKLGPEFKANAQAVADALKKAYANEVEAAIAKEGFYPLHTDRGLFNVKAEHFTVVEKLENPNAIPFRYGMAYVDKEISAELMEEAMVREFERRVQMARKGAALKKAERIVLRYEAGPSLAGIIEKNSKEIRKYVNAKSMRAGIANTGAVSEYDIEEERVRLEIERIAPERKAGDQGTSI
jgi:isoleucyl-tRNA synthetase